MKTLVGGLAARHWYRNEFPIHNFEIGKNIYHKETAHLTQMIWKGTKFFSVDTKFTSMGDLVIVYLYSPYGNYQTDKVKFADNVEDVDKVNRTFEAFLDDTVLQKYPNTNERSWYSYEDYWITA
ncbi:uncharacterized protein LOC118438702 [Folsomia candida]|uniref:uncharacterized protein LOC118438702 n=1 Tax=Folsomia candida TaxID=158441 RepID=UPI001605274A|nr:uncharacterized protein LOC118438702 [Folsomia candida]